MYHVDLDLNTDEVRLLKQMALTCDLSVRDLVTELVRREIRRPEESVEEKPVKQVPSASKESVKQAPSTKTQSKRIK